MKNFIKIISDLFKEDDFKVSTKASYCYISLPDELFFLIYLQRSSWSNCYYVNIGFAKSKKLPKWSEVFAQLRVLDMDTNRDACIDSADEAKARLILNKLFNEYSPILKKISDIRSLSSLIQGRGFLVDADGQILLSIHKSLS